MILIFFYLHRNQRLFEIYLSRKYFQFNWILIKTNHDDNKDLADQIFLHFAELL